MQPPGATFRHWISLENYLRMHAYTLPDVGENLPTSTLPEEASNQNSRADPNNHPRSTKMKNTWAIVERTNAMRCEVIIM